MNNPKIYLIKNKEGKFLNVESKDHYFANHIFNGSYGTSKIKVQQIIDALKIDAEVYESSELEFTEAMANTTTSIIIKLDSIQAELETFKYNLPTISALNKNLSNFLKNTSNKLKEINPDAKEFIKQRENDFDDVSGVYNEFIKEVSEVKLWECSELVAILKAAKKDSKSMMGLAKKINRK